jgi:hypothetical protein
MAGTRCFGVAHALYRLMASELLSLDAFREAN